MKIRWRANVDDIDVIAPTELCQTRRRVQHIVLRRDRTRPRFIDLADRLDAKQIRQGLQSGDVFAPNAGPDDACSQLFIHGANVLIFVRWLLPPAQAAMPGNNALVACPSPYD